MVSTGLGYFVAPVGGTFLRAYLFGKSVYIPSEVSFLALLNGIILAPVTKELMHRGYFQTKFRSWMKDNKALTIASFLFAMIHVPKMLFASKHLSKSFVP